MVYYRKQYFETVVSYGIFDEATIDSDGGAETEEYVVSFTEHSDHLGYEMGQAYLYSYEVAHLMLLGHNNSTNLKRLTHGEYMAAVAQLQLFDEYHASAQGIMMKMLGLKDGEKRVMEAEE